MQQERGGNMKISWGKNSLHFLIRLETDSTHEICTLFQCYSIAVCEIKLPKKPVCFNMLFHRLWFIEAKNNLLVFYKYLSGYIRRGAKSEIHSVFAEQLPVILSDPIIILWSTAHVSSNTLSLKRFCHPPDLKGEAGCNFSNRFLMCWRCRSMSSRIMHAPAVKKKKKKELAPGFIWISHFRASWAEQWSRSRSRKVCNETRAHNGHTAALDKLYWKSQIRQ